MTEFDNKDLNGQTPENGSEPTPYTTPDAASATPQLTVDPQPEVPEIPVPQEAAQNAAPEAAPQPEPAVTFHTEPPQAPQPPHPYGQPQQPQAPQYTAGQQGQYQPPQYAQQPQQPYYPQQPQYHQTPPVGYNQKSRLASGLLAILVGTFGVHNFYLGFNTKATVQLIVSLVGGLLTCGIATVGIGIWAFIEGVMILSANSSYLYDGNGVILRD